jgi:hypothetical protein
MGKGKRISCGSFREARSFTKGRRGENALATHHVVSPSYIMT